MTTSQEKEETGHARFTYRLRMSSTARTELLGEWARCRWVWNECAARSKKAHVEEEKCGPARLDKMLTEAPTKPQPLPETGAVIGIDWGVKETTTTTSDAHDLPHAEHGKKAATGLTHYQRMMARRKPAKGKPGSRGYRAAQKLTAKLHKKVARQRQDAARKWAKAVVRDHDAVAVEDFRPKFLTKSTMARKAADAAIGAAKRELIAMARKHGRIVHLVHPAHTTMDCAQCGARTKHALPLSERTYTCTACRTVSPRDKNSAHVMLVRAGLNPAGADRARADGPQVHSRREPGIPTL